MRSPILDDSKPVRVLRIIEYTGPRWLVEEKVAKSIHGTKTITTNDGTMRIRATTLGEFPEIMNSESACK